MILRPPLRWRPAQPEPEPARPEYRPRDGFLLDTPQPRLTPLSRRGYGRTPGKTVNGHKAQ